MKQNRQIERITYYEGIFDRAMQAARQLEDALDAYKNIQGGLSALEKYYTGPEWKEDYEADETGLLPSGLKRGVLSQDGIDCLLDTFRELKEKAAGQFPARPAE